MATGVELFDSDGVSVGYWSGEPDSSGNLAGNVVPKDQDIDIFTYDNLGNSLGVVASINIPMGVGVVAGCKSVLVRWVSPNPNEICFLRWDATAVASSGLAIMSGDAVILRVPQTGDRKLNVIGAAGTTPGTAINVYPIG